MAVATHLLFVLLCLLAFVTASRVRASSLRTGDALLKNETVTCRLYQVAVLANGAYDEDQEDRTYICETPQDYVVYDVELPPHFVQENEDIITSGKAELTITGALAIRSERGNYIELSSSSKLTLSYLPSASTVQTYNEVARDSRSFYGERSFLMIRISTRDTENNQVIPSASQLSSTLFGSSSSVSSQLSACSASQLTLKPARGNSQIVNGVLDVQLNVAVNGAGRTQYDDLIYSTVTQMLGNHPENLFDFVAGCYPSSFDFDGSFAYATVGGQRAWYQNFVCTNMGTIIHETGHNFGLSHSRKLACVPQRLN